MLCAEDERCGEKISNPETLLEVIGIPLMLAEIHDGDASRLAEELVNDALSSTSGPVYAGLIHNAMVCSDDPPQLELSTMMTY